MKRESEKEEGREYPGELEGLTRRDRCDLEQRSKAASTRTLDSAATAPILHEYASKP